MNENRTTPKAFVTQYIKQLDFGVTEKYGEVVFLSQKEYRPEPVPEGYNDVVILEIKKNLMDYVPGVDYIVVTGSSMPNLIVGAMLASRPGKHKILKWSNLRKDYEVNTFET